MSRALTSPVVGQVTVPVSGAVLDVRQDIMRDDDYDYGVTETRLTLECRPFELTDVVLRFPDGTSRTFKRLVVDALAIRALALPVVDANGNVVLFTTEQQQQPLSPLAQAVNAAPDDSDLRLVYSDWLEEAGRPEEAKVQRELALAQNIRASARIKKE